MALGADRLELSVMWPWSNYLNLMRLSILIRVMEIVVRFQENSKSKAVVI